MDAGAAVNLGVLTFGFESELYGGAFYNGSYYALVNGSDTIRRVNFNGSGSIDNWDIINLPENRTMYLGDLDFDSKGNLWISGNNSDDNSISSISRLWKYSTENGEDFLYADTLTMKGCVITVFFSILMTTSMAIVLAIVPMVALTKPLVISLSYILVRPLGPAGI